MQLYMSWYIRSFFGFTFLNILYFFKYSCTNIFHRRSLYTFYKDSHYKYKTIVRPSYLYYGNSYTGKTAFLYWNGPWLYVVDDCNVYDKQLIVGTWFTEIRYTLRAMFDRNPSDDWGLWCQKQISQAGISNCTPQNRVWYHYLSLSKFSIVSNIWLIESQCSRVSESKSRFSSQDSEQRQAGIGFARINVKAMSHYIDRVVTA